MNYKRLFIFLIFGIILFFGFYFDRYDNSTKQILDQVINREGYIIREIEPVSLEIYIKPEWIPFDTTRPQKLNIKLLEKNNTIITLQQVVNRRGFADDIYFSFHTAYTMIKDQGIFLSNYRFNDDGSVSQNFSYNDFSIYDSSKKQIMLGETGAGPGSDFSFGVEKDQFEEIRDGFYVKYTGMISYEYSKK
jgi:hypothetical protein